MNKNISASVRDRLLNLARKDKRPFNELLQYYSMERFLYRLSLSRHSDKLGSAKVNIQIDIGFGDALFGFKSPSSMTKNPNSNNRAILRLVNS